MAAERDPRASRLEDDPFERVRSPASHTKARDDGNWRRPHVRVVFANNGQGGQPFFRVFGEEPQPRRVYVHKGSIWHFSKIEIEHLFQATLAFSVALAFMSVGGIFGALNSPSAFLMGGLFWMIPAAPAFIVHELAHKVSALMVIVLRVVVFRLLYCLQRSLNLLYPASFKIFFKVMKASFWDTSLRDGNFSTVFNKSSALIPRLSEPEET